MACGNCGSGVGIPRGCGSKGNCSSGGCNRLNVFDWLSDITQEVNNETAVEVSFKNGSVKDYFQFGEVRGVDTGDMVVVDTGNGKHTGMISATGDLVKIQMKRKKIKTDEMGMLVRRAEEKDLEQLAKVRKEERETLVRARSIARSMNLDMKIGDIHFQMDRRKVTIYYTANGRVDFRELIKVYAKEFKTKIEMRQIGARQEAGMIGGIGACGRELCCSTWLTEFKSVNTAVARYQNLSINQTKLSGQCGRLKCCLNYELDTYLDALKEFPQKADYLITGEGKAKLIKTDIFKRLMFYSYPDSSKLYPLSTESVRNVLEMNKNNKEPANLVHLVQKQEVSEVEPEYEDLVGHISLSSLKGQGKNRKKGNRRNRRNKGKK